MKLSISILLSALLGYLFGTINPAYIISKIKGFDIRETGSGNAGASNATIVLGKAAGIFTALFDIFKSFFSIKIAEHFFVSDGDIQISGCIAGACCIIGHIFPALMNFKGGKGLACLGGCVISLGLKPFLVYLTVELVFVLMTDYICVASVSGSLAFPFVYYYLTGNIYGSLIFIFPAIVMLIKHIENYNRIKIGVEAHFSGLWSREKEEKRVENCKISNINL